jgi:hypothetical protein
MATITADEYLDSGTARTAGETWTLNGGKLTVRTDTRWHANAPASMTGSLSNVTVSPTLGGGILYDARNVRWMPYDTGSGNVPAIGTSITQGGVTGYLLGVWDTLTSAPTAVGAAMPANGFIKFREVTGGPFSTGALTGIGASATGPDVVGWIEVVMDQAATHTTSRAGTGIQSRGDWFYLDDTDGTVGQTLQVPTNGGGAGTRVPGVWIETSPGSDEYVFWPSLSGSGNGWSRADLGQPVDATDVRASFVKDATNGAMTIGEAWGMSGTYTVTNETGTYTWANDTITVTDTAHGYLVGEQVRLDFTSGGATADGVYTILTVPSTSTFTVALTGSGTGGNVSYVGLLTVSATAHGLSAGQRVTVDFTSGSAPDGVYEIRSTSINAFVLNVPTVASDSGNLDLDLTIGHIPEAGCKTRVPNVFLRQCATGSRATNAVPHNTIATRPDFVTTGAGIVDFEYAYGDWYFAPAQAYQFRLHHCATLDAITVSEIATALDLNDVGFGMYLAADQITVSITSCFAGGTFTDVVAFRGNTPGSSDHVGSFASVNDLVLNNCVFGVVQTGRSSGYAFNLSSCAGFVFNDCTSVNSSNGVNLATTVNTTINDHSYCNRIIGRTTATQSGYIVAAAAKCNDTLVDGVVFGYRGVAIEGTHPYTGFASVTSCDRFSMRNIGAPDTPSTSLTNGANTPGYIFASGGNNNGITLKRIYVGLTRSTLGSFINSDKNVLMESCGSQYLNTKMAASFLFSALNGRARGCFLGTASVAANQSVYGTHWQDYFTSNTVGLLLLPMIEPTAETESLFTLTGTPQYTSVPSLILDGSTDAVESEMDYYAQGHTGFGTAQPTLTGTTAKSASLAYTWASNTVTVTHTAHGYKTGDVLWVDFTSGGATADGLYTITVTSANAYTFTLSGSGTAGNLTTVRWIDFAYKIDKNDGNGFSGTWENLHYTRDSCATTNASAVITMASTAGIAVDDYVYGTGVGTGAKVVTVDSATQITVSVNSTSTGSGRTLVFNQLPNETIDPVDGFKLRVKISTPTPNSLNTVTYLSIPTTSTQADQEAVAYPLDTVTVTVTVKDVTTGDPIEDARVYLAAGAGGPATEGAVILSGLTNASGVLTGTTEYTAQAVLGRVRRATVSYGTLYKSAVINDTVGASGLDVTVLMIPDE